MTADDFRKIALSCPEAVESAHMSHPDFRVRGKIFATLGYPDQEWATLKLTPAEQSEFIEADPDVFRPVKGAWGRRGNTNVYLSAAKIGKMRKVIRVAWRNAAPKPLARHSEEPQRYNFRL
ncbi:MAG: hypothetical protein DME84_08765 [Verrucomicrobia bacterium]|nr:MAG: hypothetical protein DME84_08765 [Verrucomicrobiota bacterium]